MIRPNRFQPFTTPYASISARSFSDPKRSSMHRSGVLSRRTHLPKNSELRSMRTFLLAFTLLAFPLVHAQHGPRLGVSLATQSAGGLFQNTSDLLIGPLVGWHFEAPVHQQVSIMPEVLFMTKGFAFRNPIQATRTRRTFRYLEVPILAKVSVDKDPGGLYLLAGPSIGYFITGRNKVWQENQLLFDQQFSLPANGRRLEFSGLVGMGMEGERLAFDVRAQTSLTPFERFTRIQNVVYAFTVAYRIRKAQA